MNAPSRLGSRFRIDLFDAIVFVAFAGLSVWLLVILLSKNGPNHVWTGTDGPYVGDQMQFVAWIRDASRHVLASDPFRTNPGVADYLNPGVVISGLLVRLGITPTVAFLVWKPVAVVALFGAARSYIYRVVTRTAQRRFALVLALFYLSPIAAFTSHMSWLPGIDRIYLPAVSTEMWPGLYLWGYPFTAIAVASLAFALLAYERGRTARRVRPWAPLLGLLCAWLQPWQGATVLGVVIVSEVALRLLGEKGNVALLVSTTLATAAPLGYYAWLSHFDPNWANAGRINYFVTPPLVILLALGPLGLPAILAYRLRPATFQDVALRAWPIVALGLFGFIALTHIGTFPQHVLQGISIPFATLAVIGASSIRFKLGGAAKIAVGIACVALLLVPFGAKYLNSDRTVGDSTGFGEQPFFVTAGERNALNYLDNSPRTGSVLTSIYLGQIMPAETGHQSWLGSISWTPDYDHRVALADSLFSGELDSARALALIRSSGARFLLSDCQHHADLTKLLAPVLISARHFGCATVYQVSTRD